MPRPGESFETARLHFRLLQDGDLDDIHRQFSDPEMCKYFSEPPMDRPMAAATIEFFRHPERDPYLRYAMIHRETGEFVGTCGYHHLDPERQQVELGYDVWKAHWRTGFASEALRPLIDMCFQELAVKQVYVLIDRDNVGSIRTAQKFGFEQSEPCRPLDAPDQVCMKLTQRDWGRSQSHID
jgi:[ribosomal protein S5]-alanine N-acetyltransferase